MGTEIAISFNSLRTQLENERSSLFKIDENIKKIVQTSGRFPNDRFNPAGHYARGGQQLGGRNSFADFKNHKNEEQLFGKRKTETKTVFSRLSARQPDSDGEDDAPGIKRAKVPSAVSRELPTRAAVLRAQGGDEQARTRNRRIFGSLLGTLQKFKQEEIVLQTKEEKKALVERKIEEQARLEKEREQKERKTLFAERESKKATIKALEAKMARVQEFEKWEASQKNLANFILTKTRPHIYWLPKRMTDKATEKLDSSRKFHETKYGPLYRRYMVKKRQELQEELQRIEQRCLRTRIPGTKENDPENLHAEKEKAVQSVHSEATVKNEEEDKGSKRNKFAMDVDEQEDSDGDDRHEEEISTEKPREENVKDENQMETNAEEDALVTTDEVSVTTKEVSVTEEPMVDGPEEPMVDGPEEPMVDGPEEPMVDGPEEPMVDGPEELMVITVEPSVTTEEPLATTEEPLVTTEEPLVTTEEVLATTEEPSVTTKEPSVTTEEPSVTTEVETVDTEEALVTTEDASITAQDVLVKTEEPKDLDSREYSTNHDTHNTDDDKFPVENSEHS